MNYVKQPNLKNLETDVLIIGGGSTGTGIFRDCCLRGMSTILVERDDIASGTTGRNHGLLHSGARYAVTDQHSAAECISENKILKKIAKHCIEETDGLFITLPEDDINFQQQFIDSCQNAGINAERIDTKQAILLEPSCNPTLTGAVKVPDGTLDPFRLCSANIIDGKNHGGNFFNNTKVINLIKDKERIIGVICQNIHSLEIFNIYAQQVVNAAGIWGQMIAQYADLNVKMFPSKGSLIIFDYRINNLVINRCRKPADADILVPGDSISLLGTTSEKIEYSQIDNLQISAKEIDILLSEGAKLAPIIEKARVLRAYAGVRPLISIDGDESGRNISRGIVLLDHGQRDGLHGLVTITGGKLMTYRLMAQMATDVVAKNIGNDSPCITDKQALPGSAELVVDAKTKQKIYKGAADFKKNPTLSMPVYQSAIYRHGEQAESFLKNDLSSKAIICECEMVTRGEIEYALESLDVHNLVDLRRRTRLGMGPCQGELCAYRAAGLFKGNQEKHNKNDPNGNDDNSRGNKNNSNTDSNKLLIDFMEERFKGVRPILAGDAMRETEFTYWIYESLLGASECHSELINKQIKSSKK